MESPKGGENTGWFAPGVRPGDIGSAVISGHAGFQNNKSAAFDRLGQVRIGDTVQVTNSDGTLLTFVVRNIKSYPANADASPIFNSDDGKAHLNLITCNGFWNLFTRSHANRLVVFTDLVAS